MDGHLDDQPLIAVRDLHRDYVLGGEAIHALDGLTLDIPAGDFMCVMGPSGSGKSTLLYLIGGLERPTSGQIMVHGETITHLDEDALAHYRRRRVGFIFQTFNLISTMTALQNVEFPMIFDRRLPRERRERAVHLLDMVGLSGRMNHMPTQLSGGQQQRVAVARALVNDPDILLADEPTGNLDSHIGAEVMELLARLNAEEKRTLLVVTHDPNVARFGKRTVRLLDGKLEKGAEERT
jgi:putative ABC transport system ATP-binding protein